MKILDLFSGTHSVNRTRMLYNKNWNIISVDLINSDYNVDILNWNYKKAFKPKFFDVIWASPPCRYFSILRSSNIGKKGFSLESILKDREEKGLPLLNKTLELIDYLQPKWYFIENPDSGAMKNYICNRPSYVIDYCQYSNWGYRKRTRIWTNLINFNPKLCNKAQCKNVILNTMTNKKIHKLRTDGGGRGQKGTTRNERYRVPELLIKELIDMCDVELILEDIKLLFI
ncbi:DNA methyltransferase [Lymphocystis disease virus 1]|uniref:DNA (Cytosine-5) methyltransferase n=1 Tax=Fish lymphocystis disease virus TaxID=36363 RepID=Q9YPG4_FLDV|nr:DNA methyltransferase [Lymphocystis disease virus 1]AAB50571.1 DNA (cytosine-5) methyltransferase [Lymphocystis disease virus 1]